MQRDTDNHRKPRQHKDAVLEDDYQDELRGYCPKRQDQTASDLSGARFDRSDPKPKYSNDSQNWDNPRQAKYQEPQNDREVKKSKIISSKYGEEEEDDKGKFVEHDLNWDDDNDKGWGNSEPKFNKNRNYANKNSDYQSDFNHPQQSNYRGQRGNRGGYPNRRGGNYHYDSHQRTDYRRNEQNYYHKNQRGGRDFDREDKYQRKGGAGSILDTQARKSDFTSIADYFSRKMVDDKEWHHRLERDPGPESVKKNSRWLLKRT